MISFRLCILMLFISTLIYAQDAHYWTEQFGTRSMLLSNSVVGSVDDLGAVYYNPARLGLIENPAFIISGKVYQLSRLSFENLTGDSPEASKKRSSFGGAPNLVAGTYRIKGWDKHYFAYAFLTRRSMDVSVASSVDTYGDNIVLFPGNEYLSGTVELNKKFDEEWFGGTWSYVPKTNFSIGLTGFVTTRDQNAFEKFQLQTYTSELEVETYYNYKDYKFTHIGLIWKMGLAYQMKFLSLGLTFTTPTISILGNGSMVYERYFTYAVEDGNPIYERNTQADLGTKYRTPFTIAGGLGYSLWKGTLHLSGEYYHKVNHYVIMEGKTFTGQSTGSEITPVLGDQLKSVFNYGIGYSLEINDKLNFYLSYSTDYSAAIKKNDNQDEVHKTIFSSGQISNIYHLGGGFVMNLKRADVTLGVTYAKAKFPLSRPINFPEDDDGGLILDPDETTYLRWERWRFIVGISVSFLEDVATKLENKIFKPEDKNQGKTPDKI